ncbi:MAG: D-amino-acid transaminase [Pseudomonadota bacterium]
MARIAYANGVYAPISAPMICAEDRGYQFSDGVYEVLLLVDGLLWDAPGHLARWQRSLDELEIAAPMSEPAMRSIIRQVVRRNRLRNALIYMQATRGIMSRNHVYPQPAAPSFVVTARPFDLSASHAKAEKGVKLMTAPDIRWSRADIKSISLLPNVLAKEKARQSGAAEAMFHRDGIVTEGGSTNIWMVDDHGAIRTHPLSRRILGGITRASVVQCAQEMQMTVLEDAFTLDDAKSAREVFITSATSLVIPATHIDETPISDGEPGPVATALRESYERYCRNTGICP